MDDELYMRQALALACLAEGDTSPILCSAVIVSADGEVVGEGYHHKAGSLMRDQCVEGSKKAGPWRNDICNTGALFAFWTYRTLLRGDYCCRTETCGCGGRRPEPQGCRQRF